MIKIKLFFSNSTIKAKLLGIDIGSAYNILVDANALHLHLLEMEEKENEKSNNYHGNVYARVLLSLYDRVQ